jgi:general secretion pathway protein K
MATGRPKGVRQAGFALLIVLWALVLLSLILTQLLSTGRTEAQLAGNLRNQAVAQAVADGAVQEALFHLVSGGRDWLNGTHVVRIGRGVAQVSVEDEGGKINPNMASPALLRAAFGLCGLGGDQASALAEAVQLWRSPPEPGTPAVVQRAAGVVYAAPGAPIETLDELVLVNGMTPALLACLRPHLSLYEDGTPTPATQDPFVAKALTVAAQLGETVSATAVALAPAVVSVTARAEASGGRFTRHAIARLLIGNAGQPFRILTWDTAPSE